MVLDFIQKENLHIQKEKMLKNVIIFGDDLSNSIHATQSVLHNLFYFLVIIYHKKINDTTTYAEKMYSPNFTVDNKAFCLSLHYNDGNSYLLVNGK